ncbi:MAG: PAS domain-containing protein [Bacteroidia bacterium]
MTDMATEELGESLLQYLPVLIWASDTHGKIIYVNETLLEFRGRSMKEETGSKGIQGIHQDDEEACLSQLLEHLETRTPFDCECRLQREDGTYRWMQNLGRPRYNESGEFIGFAGSLIDISDRKQATEHRALSQKQLIAAQHLANVGSWEWDMEKDQVVWSDELFQIFGLAPGTPVDFSRYTSFLHPEDRERVEETIRVAITHQRPYRFHHRIINTRGEVRWLHSLGETVVDDKGKPTGLIGTAQDVTDLKNAEALIKDKNRELQQTNQSLEEFAHVTSHDLKAPLRAISNLAQWLYDDNYTALGKEGQEHLKLIINKAQAMHRLIESILEYSRAGAAAGKKEPCDVRLILENTLTMITVPKNITLKIPEVLPVMQCERTKLLQVFSNLISNAIRYNDKPHGLIEIKYKDLPSFHEFSVLDNGKGIHPKYHQSIFKMFETLDKDSMPDSSGIGLALVKKIIAGYGGAIKVKSEPGKGSEFIFTIMK